MSASVPLLLTVRSASGVCRLWMPLGSLTGRGLWVIIECGSRRETCPPIPPAPSTTPPPSLPFRRRPIYTDRPEFPSFPVDWRQIAQSLCVCLSLCMCVSVCLYVCSSLCVCLSLRPVPVRLSVSVGLCLSVYMFARLSVLESVCLYVCLRPSVCLSLSICVWAPVSVCMCVFTCMSANLSLRLGISVSACFCLCASVSVCLSLFLRPVSVCSSLAVSVHPSLASCTET